jgi:hypothetical protein
LVIKTLDPDPDSMNLDPQLCLKASQNTSMNKNKTKYRKKVKGFLTFPGVSKPIEFFKN